MKANYITKSRLSILAAITVAIAMLATAVVGHNASAARSKAGPVYSTYSQCDKARKAYNSSWTRSSTCYKQPWYQNGMRYYKGYSFTIYYRY